MKWLVFSYSLPAKINPNARVRIWRKLRKLGTVSPKIGVHILPYTDDCLDALRWIAVEVEQEEGDALLMQVDHFENLPDEKVIEFFRKQRAEDYQTIESLLEELEEMIQSAKDKKTTPQSDNVVLFTKNIKKLKKNIDEVSRVDYFNSQDKRPLLNRLHHLQQKLLTGNLIIVILFNLGVLNTFVLRKMREESMVVSRTTSKFKIRMVNGQFELAI